MSVERVDRGGGGRRGRPRTAPLGPEADRTGQRAMPAAAFAALAESGLLFLPARMVCVQLLKASAGPFASYLLFVAVFTGGCALATRFRRARWMPLFVMGGAVLAALAQTAASNAERDLTVGVSLFLALGVGSRVIALAVRDWRNPVTASFGWGAIALLVEIAAASSMRAGWESLLPVIVPVFFAGSLASRALSVQLTAEDAAGLTAPDAPSAEAVPPGVAPRRMVFALVAGLLGVIALGAALGNQGGALQRIGGFVWTAVVWVIVAIAFVLAILATPLTALLRGLNLDLAAGLRRVANQIRRVGFGRGRPKPAPPMEIPWLGRALGLVAVVLVAMVVWRLVRRRRRPPEWGRAGAAAGSLSISEAGAADVATVTEPRRRRADLPKDTVRRWYAELLLLLEARGLAKPGPATPREYVGTVAAAFPDGGEAFDSLTRAYEEVRYAGRSPDRARLRAVKADREAAAAVIRKAKRADVPEDDEGGGDDQGPAERGDLRG
jgi:uncharacterized protein DUF4129